MITTTRASIIATIAVLVALLAFASQLAGAAAVSYQPESFTEYRQQLAHGGVRAVTVNKRVRSLRVTLKDGRFVLARYKPKEEQRIVAALQAKHVPVTVLTATEASKEVKHKPVKHKLRYIAGGVLIVVVVIVVAVLLIRRRRYAEY